MTAISVRRLDPELHAWLQEQASAHGVSMEEEVRRVLRAAREAAEAERREAGMAAMEAVLALAYQAPPGAPTAVDLLREDRDSH